MADCIFLHVVIWQHAVTVCLKHIAVLHDKLTFYPQYPFSQTSNIFCLYLAITSVNS